MNEIKPSNSENTNQAGNALRVATIVFVAAIAVVLFYIFLAWQLGAWQMYLLAGVIAAFSVVNFAALRTIRQGKSETGSWMIIIGMAVVFPAAALLISNMGMIFGLALVILTTLVTNQTLSGKQARRSLAVSIGVGLLTAATDLLKLQYRLFVPAIQTFIPAITGTILLVMLFFVARRFWGASLRAKMVISFLAITIIPLAVTSLITYYSSRSALTNAANQKLGAAASQTASDIDMFFDQNLENIRAAGKFPAVVDYLMLPAAQRPGSPEEDRLIKALTALSRQDPIFISSVAVMDTHGITLADTNVADIGSDKSSRDYFKATIEKGTPYLSDVEHSATSGVPSIYLSAPVRDTAGKMLGIIRIRYAASLLQKLVISDSGLAGEHSYAVLLNSNNIRLAHGSDRNRVFKSIVPLDSALLKDLQSKGLMPAGTPEELSTNFTDFESGLENWTKTPFFAAETNGDGTLEQVSVVPLRSRDWVVAFVQPQDVFLAPVTEQVNFNLLIAFALAVMVGAAGFLFSQTLAGPVIRLTQVAEAIAGGNIDIQAKVETGDEIGKLAETFNRMTQQLRDFIATLEQRVAARTKDLATVAEVGTATATILETDRLLQEVVDLTKERFGLYHSHIYLLDAAGENLVLAAGAGEPGRQMVSEGRSIPLSREQSLVARAARERKGVTVNDVTQAPDFLANPLLPDTRSELAVPMIVGGNVIGVFDIQSDEVGRFAESDISIQTTLAAQLATSVQNVRQFEQSKARADLETLVNTIGQKIQRTATVDETLQTAAREIGLALGAARVSASLQVSDENSSQSAAQLN